MATAENSGSKVFTMIAATLMVALLVYGVLTLVGVVR